MPYKSITVALAGKENEASVIRETIRLARIAEAELTVLHVNDPHAGEHSMMMHSEPLVTEQDLRTQLRDLGFETEAETVRVIIITGSSYPKEIARATRDADLLVIGHRQKDTFLHALIHSVDKHIVDLVNCPILILPREQE